jgi:murein DD-endopeptidase MepM/ murein hydrolase activator NlpD
MHYGVDFSTSTGTPIKAADGGTVTLSGWYYGYGYTVIIDHGSGVKTLYGHCSALYVSVGEKVYQGQTIAAVGNTGNSTGPHCHFEIIINGTNVNPENYL